MVRSLAFGGIDSGTALAAAGILAMLLIVSYSPRGGVSVPTSSTSTSGTSTTAAASASPTSPTQANSALSASNETAVRAQVERFVAYLGKENASGLLGLYADSPVSSWTGNPIALTYDGAVSSLAGNYIGKPDIGIAYLQLFQSSKASAAAWSVRPITNLETARVVATGPNAADATFGLAFPGEEGYYNPFIVTVNLEQLWVYHAGSSGSQGWSIQSETWNFTSYQFQGYMITER